MARRNLKCSDIRGWLRRPAPVFSWSRRSGKGPGVAIWTLVVLLTGALPFLSGCRHESDKNRYLYAALYYELTKNVRTFAASCKLTYQCNNYYNGYSALKVQTLCTQYGGTYSTGMCTGTSAVYYCRYAATPSTDEIYYTGTATTQASVSADCALHGGSFGTGYPP